MPDSMKHVLLVEDEAPLREALAEQLVDRGYAVEQAESGETALASLSGAQRSHAQRRSVRGRTGETAERYGLSADPGIDAARPQVGTFGAVHDSLVATFTARRARPVGA